jgi:hypothetical protein
MRNLFDLQSLNLMVIQHNLKEYYMAKASTMLLLNIETNMHLVHVISGKLHESVGLGTVKLNTDGASKERSRYSEIMGCFNWPTNKEYY